LKSAWKSSAALIFSALLVASTSSTVSAEPFQFDPAEKLRFSDGSKRSLQIEESYEVGVPSRVQLKTVMSMQRTNRFTCVDFPSSACPEDLLNASRPFQAGESYLTFPLLMPACQVSDGSDFCIEELRIYGKDSYPSPAEFLKSVDNTTTPSVPSMEIPAGGHVSLWQGAPNTGFEGLKVAAIVQVNMEPGPQTTLDGVAVFAPFQVQDFTAQLVPYKESTGGQFTSLDTPYSTPDLSGFIAPKGLEQGCVWQVPGRCGMRIDSPADVRFGITIRSNLKLGTFLNGRLMDPEVQVQVLDDLTTIRVDGEPSVVSEFGEVFSPTPELREKFPFLSDSSNSTRPFYPNAMEYISALRESLGDRASGENTNWRISTAGIIAADPCFDKNSLSGIVTTNATAYSSDPPKLQDGYLNYKVAGMHYRSNGSDLALGTYDLVMRSDVARCLYGFKNAPISATVAVVGEMGEEKVATTIVSEKDGWLKLAAYGFTFSENTIQVQLRQSQIKTLSDFSGSTTTLSSAQKSQIRSVLSKSDGNTKFICTGIRYYNQPMSDNIKVRARAKAACDYAKSIDPNFSYWYQTKTTQARSYNGKVMIVSKG
jgi:hypothetical protein